MARACWPLIPTAASSHNKCIHHLLVQALFTSCRPMPAARIPHHLVLLSSFTPAQQGKSPSLVLGRQPKDVALRIGGERQGVWLTVVEVPLPLPRSIAEGQPRQLKGLICDEDGPMFVVSRGRRRSERKERKKRKRERAKMGVRGGIRRTKE